MNSWRLEKDLSSHTYLNINNGDTIGRQGATHSFPDDEKMSRIHARFIIAQNDFFVFDLGSTNGTKVGIENCEPKVRTPVSAGSEILIGKKSFRLEEYEGAFEVKEQVVHRPQGKIIPSAVKAAPAKHGIVTRILNKVFLR